MKTFLFVWNPRNWKWTALNQGIDIINQSGYFTEEWSVISHRKIQQGDRVFLMRLGVEPKGIMASGYVSSPVFKDKHWNGSNKLVHKVLIDFEVLLNPETNTLLDLDVLNVGRLSKVNWTPQSSGIEIKDEFVDDLEQLWLEFIGTNKFALNQYLPTEIENQQAFNEGAQGRFLVTKYERNQHARNECLKQYGYKCVICDFNFEEKYGEIGRGFIHVHHLAPISTIGKEHKLNPIIDLRPVCPNCHSMIHKRLNPFSIEEIIKKMNSAIYL